MADLTDYDFEVWHHIQDGWGARADVSDDHPYRLLSAFGPTPHDALRELVEVVIPAAEDLLTE
jgi:hypothetical protein